jgi:hypothetical protein
MLAARALMETLAVMAEFENPVGQCLARDGLGGLDALAQQGIFASCDPGWTKEFPETKAVNVLSYIDKFDKRVKGFRGHYDMLSERCHPNSLGHNFMFSTWTGPMGLSGFAMNEARSECGYDTGSAEPASTD